MSAFVNIEAEAACLGAVLLSDRCLHGLIHEEHLLPEHFYRDRHRVIWQAMTRMHHAGERVDTITLVAHLWEHGMLEAVCGKAGVDELAAGVPCVGAVRQYARHVVRLWRWRTRAGLLEELRRAGWAMDEQEYARLLDALAATLEPRPGLKVVEPSSSPLASRAGSA